MTKEETKKAIEVMQAYVDGKKIQKQEDNGWTNLEEPSWVRKKCTYRIKSEKHVRPYTFKEMCEAVRKHGLLVKTKGEAEVFTVFGFDNENVCYKMDICETYEEFMNFNVWFDDNSPCGIEEE